VLGSERIPQTATNGAQYSDYQEAKLVSDAHVSGFRSPDRSLLGHRGGSAHGVTRAGAVDPLPEQPPILLMICRIGLIYGATARLKDAG